jgi:DNA-directed RNA polymerase specialized sigma24 family protein
MLATNRLIDVIRRERRVHRRESAVESLPDIAAGESGNDAVDVEAIHAALAALPDRQRQVIEGLKFQDRSVKEMAGVIAFASRNGLSWRSRSRPSWSSPSARVATSPRRLGSRDICWPRQQSSPRRSCRPQQR